MKKEIFYFGVVVFILIMMSLLSYNLYEVGYEIGHKEGTEKECDYKTCSKVIFPQRNQQPINKLNINITSVPLPHE